MCQVKWTFIDIGILSIFTNVRLFFLYESGFHREELRNVRLYPNDQNHHKLKISRHGLYAGKDRILLLGIIRRFFTLDWYSSIKLLFCDLRNWVSVCFSWIIFSKRLPTFLISLFLMFSFCFFYLCQQSFCTAPNFLDPFFLLISNHFTNPLVSTRYYFRHIVKLCLNAIIFKLCIF